MTVFFCSPGTVGRNTPRSWFSKTLLLSLLSTVYASEHKAGAYIRWRASWLLLKAVILLLRLHLPGFCCRSAVPLWKVCDIGHGDTWLYWESSTSHFTHKYMSNVISWFDIIVSCGILYKILNSLLMKLLNGMEKIPTPIKKNNPQFILFIAIIRL